MMKDEAKPVKRLRSYLPWQLLNRLDILRTMDMSEWAQEGTKFHRQRWHNQKYYTWVEQQGKPKRSGDAQCRIWRNTSTNSARSRIPTSG
jgi:hypothetical protein